MDGSTIAAICTPRGFGGVGIIKISGPECLRIVRKIFRPISAKQATPTDALSNPGDRPRSHLLRYGIIVTADGRRLDEVLLAIMLAPKSYTGEDVVEINAHAGPIVLDSILETVLDAGARMAQPGEFTRRAFLNGRIDLTQAEAVMDLIHAKTSASAAMASALLAGGLRKEIETIREDIRRAIALNEAIIDFPEDIDDIGDAEGEIKWLQERVVGPLDEIVSRFRGGHIYREGLRLAVVGRPNVGKSSLMNRLIKQEKVIVSDVPGTTRDAVEDWINIKGIPVVIIDTAGLQETVDPVEIIGIEKTRQNISRADLILFVVEEGAGILDSDRDIFEKVADKPLIIVINKKDLGDRRTPTVLPEEWKGCRTIAISALTGEGINELENEIGRFVGGEEGALANRDFAPNVRQNVLLKKSSSAARGAIECHRSGDSGELIAIELGTCLDGLNGVLGSDLKEDVLGRIFGEFCIGK